MIGEMVMGDFKILRIIFTLILLIIINLVDLSNKLVQIDLMRYQQFKKIKFKLKRAYIIFKILMKKWVKGRNYQLKNAFLILITKTNLTTYKKLQISMLDIKTLKLKILYRVHNKFTMKVEASNKMMKGINKDLTPQTGHQEV